MTEKSSTTRGPGDDLRVYVQVPGVVVPAWLAVVFACALILSTAGFLLSLYLARTMRADLENRLFRIEGELRLLQLHTVDVENVLIRGGHANRADMAPWPPLLDGEKPDAEGRRQP